MKGWTSQKYENVTGAANVWEYIPPFPRTGLLNGPEIAEGAPAVAV